MRNAVILLIVGWFLGAASGLLYMQYSRSPAAHERRAQVMRERFLRDIKASPEQRAKIETLLQNSRQKLSALFAEARPRVEAVRQATRGEIRALLNPEQQTMFDQWDAKLEKKFKRRLERMQQKWQ